METRWNIRNKNTALEMNNLLNVIHFIKCFLLETENKQEKYQWIKEQINRLIKLNHQKKMKKNQNT